MSGTVMRLVCIPTRRRIIRSERSFYGPIRLPIGMAPSRFRRSIRDGTGGRAVHIHAKVRIFNGLTSTYEFTTQFFFDDAITDKVYQAAPYNSRGRRDTLNTVDGIYQGPSLLGSLSSNSGTLLMLNLDAGETSASGSIDLVVDESLGSSRSQVPGTGGGPGGPGRPAPGN